jgi:predicted Zn-dependent protease
MKTRLDQANDELRKKHIGPATHLYVELIQTDPENAVAHQGLAACLFASKEYERAGAEAREALRLDEGLEIPHRLLANIHLRQKRFDAYEQELHYLVQRHPDSAEIHVALGQFFLDHGRTEDGVRALDKAVELQPENWIAHFSLATAYLKQSRRHDVFHELASAYRLRRSYITAFAFASAYMSLNGKWLFPAFLIVLILSLALPIQLSVPLVLLIGGLQLAISIAYFRMKDIRNGALSALVLVIYLLVWTYLKWRSA